MSTDFRIYPVFGNEEDVYLRLIYGTDTQAGIPTGVFYDTRALPLPYTPRKKTQLMFTFNTDYLNVQHTITIQREDVTDLYPKTETFYFTPTDSTAMCALAIQLGHGANTIDVSANGDDLYTAVYTSTVYALFLHTLACQITDNVTAQLDELNTSIFSTNSTRLAEVLIGSLGQMFPKDTVANRMVTQLFVSAIMNNAGSTAGVLDAGSITCSTPKLIVSMTDTILQESWLYPMESFAAKIDQELLVWGITKHDGRAVAFNQFMLGHGLAVETPEETDSWEYVTDSSETARHEMYDTSTDDEFDFVETEEWAELNPNSNVTLQISPASGTYNPNQAIVITSSELAIYYTLDGTTPTSASNLYTTPINLLSSTTVRAAVFVLGIAYYASATYTIGILAPVITPSSGDITTETQISIQSSLLAATIYYTTDGTTPTINSTQYVSAFTLNASSTVKAIAYFNAEYSPVTTETYIVEDADEMSKSKNITLQTPATEDMASILYTVTAATLNTLHVTVIDGTSCTVQLLTGTSLGTDSTATACCAVTSVLANQGTTSITITDSSIAQGQHVWLRVSAVVGSVTTLNLSLTYSGGD